VTGKFVGGFNRREPLIGIISWRCFLNQKIQLSIDLSIYMALGNSREDFTRREPPTDDTVIIMIHSFSFIFIIFYTHLRGLYLALAGVNWVNEFVPRRCCGQPRDTGVRPCPSWRWGCCQTPPLSADLVSTQVGGNFSPRGGGFARDRTKPAEFLAPLTAFFT
jgi:hypothetical protein